MFSIRKLGALATVSLLNSSKSSRKTINALKSQLLLDLKQVPKGDHSMTSTRTIIIILKERILHSRK